MRALNPSSWYTVRGTEQTPVEALPGMARAILAAKVDALWKSSVFMGTVAIVVLPLLFVVFGRVVQVGTTFIWASAVLITLCLRVVAYRRFLRVPIESRDHKAWLRRFRSIFPLGAFVYGMSAFVVLPQDASMPQVLLVFLMVFVLGVGSMTFQAAYDLVAFSAYAFALFLPTFGYVIYARRWTEGMLLATAVVIIVPMARRTHTLVSGALEAREALKIEKAAAERAREEADLANRAKSRFLAAASHDLRQPMHALTLFVTALKENSDGPDARRLVERIVDSVAALDHLFDALLDISKLDAGIIAPRVEAFALQPLLQRMEIEYARAAREKGLSLRVAVCPVTVRSDSTLLERVLRNLLSNAVRYTHAGSIEVVCTVNADEVRVEVADTGIGIPPQHLDDIFQEFYQVENPERDRGKGLGLGLAIVKRVCELLGHPLAVRSTPGAGSAFAIEIPLGEAPALTPLLAADAHGLQRAFIVVVDDEATVVEATSTLLRASGCHVLTAASGAEALSALSHHERAPDAVICDYRLRAGETGLEVIAAIQDALGERIPALLITGDTSPERLREAAASGYHIMHKPIDPGELRRVLALEIAAARARRRTSA